jgi:FG-GAP-like repeat
MLDLPARRTRRNGPARSDVNWGRLRRRCRPRVCLFEDRTLLSAPSADPLAAVAIPIALGIPTTGTLAPGEVAFFQIDPTTDGRLVARVHAEGATTWLSLLDAQGQVLMQSDGQSPGNPDDQIDLHVPAGTDYLEVENLGGAGAYTLTTSLMPSTSPFQPIPHSAGTAPSALVAGDFNGDGRTDLAVANDGTIDVSVLLGNGDGTFQHQVRYAVGFEPDDLVAGGLHRRRPHRPGRRQLYAVAFAPPQEPARAPPPRLVVPRGRRESTCRPRLRRGPPVRTERRRCFQRSRSGASAPRPARGRRQRCRTVSPARREELENRVQRRAYLRPIGRCLGHRIPQDRAGRGPRRDAIPRTLRQSRTSRAGPRPGRAAICPHARDDHDRPDATPHSKAAEIAREAQNSSSSYRRKSRRPPADRRVFEPTSVESRLILARLSPTGIAVRPSSKKPCQAARRARRARVRRAGRGRGVRVDMAGRRRTRIHRAWRGRG